MKQANEIFHDEVKKIMAAHLIKRFTLDVDQSRNIISLAVSDNYDASLRFAIEGLLLPPWKVEMYTLPAEVTQQHFFPDMVAHPPHYNTGKIEVIEFIEDQKLGFNRGNAVKYITRAGKKDPAREIEDLKKAVWYLERDIEILKSEKQGREKARPNEMEKKA